MNVKHKIYLVQNASVLYRGAKINKKNVQGKQVRLYCDVKGKVQHKVPLKKLLDNASPLKPSLQAEEFWASNPYPEGTVFSQEEHEEEEPEKVGSVIMFPGQGNQFVGMASKIIKYSVVKDMFDEASDLLGFNLLKVCQQGPEEKLNKTEYCQPATFVCSLGALELLKDEKPWAIDTCTTVCGYSLGELSALTFAGCFSFGQAINLVKLRAKLMSTCCSFADGGMMSIVYGSETNFKEAFEDALEHCRKKGISEPVCSVAVDLFQNCKVLGGHMEALNFLAENRRKYHIRSMKRLLVSGAFHTDLMKEAAEPFKDALKKVDIQNPLTRVYSNVSGSTYKSAGQVLKLLPMQMYLPVKWEKTMQRVFNNPNNPNSYPFSFECGPGGSLKTALGKVNRFAAESCYAVRLN